MTKIIPEVNLHPTTIRLLKEGHPWVIKDEFTSKFPAGVDLLIGLDRNENKFAILINDPAHPRIKARFWCKYLKDNQLNNFEHDLNQRIKASILKRKSFFKERKRENFYIIFSDADFLSGLFVQYLSDTVLIQTYSDFWVKYMDEIVNIINRELIQFLGDQLVTILWQKRQSKKSEHFTLLQGEFLKSKVVSEFGLKYILKFNQGHDFGIYSDISEIRKSIEKYYKKSKTILNLYSYTGAFSLMALKHGAEKVTSVDISKKYMLWLEENLEINNLNVDDKHKSIISPVDKYIKNNLDLEFDFIICDPPTASFNGKQVTQALRDYELLLPKLVDLCKVNGNVLIFLNTHRIKRSKFISKIKDILIKNSLDRLVIIKKEYELSHDCPRLSGFPEGDYLKGIMLEKLKK